jgi:hypothetical protein
MKITSPIATGQIDNLKNLVSSSEGGEDRVSAGIKYFLGSEEVERAKYDKERHEEHMNNIQNFDCGWEVYSKDEKSTIYLKTKTTEEESKTLTFGGECIIDAPMIYPIVILGEHEMLKDWIPFLSEVDVLHQRSLFKRLIHIKLDLPFPIANRDIICEVVGFP